MESGYVTGLYHFLGLSVGAEFSAADVALLYRKVFQLPTSADEARAAMQKAASGDKSWLCVGKNVLEVLLEMEREREKQEKQFWDAQLMNAGMQATPVDASIHSPAQGCLCDTPELNPRGKVRDLGGRDELEVEKTELDVIAKAARKLKKAAGQSWANIASEGVQCMLRPSQREAPSPKVRGQAWGCVSLSDVLLMLDMKFDAVTHLLYTEMLREHYTLTNWLTMLPWQRCQEEKELEDLAEEALESADVLRLAELPGAFKIYRSVTFNSCAESEEQSWSAASLLLDLHAIHQREKEAVLMLGERLDRENLKLICLHIKLATLRAQREKTSYGALLAAQQSWETWPQVRCPCRADQAAWWLHSRGQQQNEDCVFTSPTQSPLQLLVLNQERERKQLLKLLGSVTLQDLEEKPPNVLPGQEDFRNGCVKKLKQIYTDLLEQNGARKPLDLQQEPGAQRSNELQSRQRVALCRLHLLEELMELQEVQASALMHNDHEAKKVDISALQLLVTDSNKTSGLAAAPHPSVSTNPSCDEDARYHASDCELVEVVTLNSEPNPSRGQRADGGSSGGVVEVLPYLEIACGSDATSNKPASPFQEGGVEMKGDDSLEKQGSLIALAWSKPTEQETPGTDREAAVQPESQAAAELCGSFTAEVRSPVTGADCDLATHTLAAEALQGLSDHRPRLLRDGDDGGLCPAPLDVELEVLPARREPRGGVPRENAIKDGERAADAECDRSPSERETSFIRPVSAMERERAMRSLVDMQRKVEWKQQRGRERQLLRVQERLSIVQTRKAEEDLLGLNHEERLRHLTQDLPQEDKSQQKTVVRERLEQLRRERSSVLQSKRDRNTAGLKELLGPVVLHCSEPGEETD